MMLILTNVYFTHSLRLFKAQNGCNCNVETCRLAKQNGGKILTCDQFSTIDSNHYFVLLKLHHIIWVINNIHIIPPAMRKSGQLEIWNKKLITSMAPQRLGSIFLNPWHMQFPCDLEKFCGAKIRTCEWRCKYCENILQNFTRTTWSWR